MKIPEFYYKRYQDDTYEYIYVSEYEKEGYIKSEEFSIGRYTMSWDGTRVHSKSGVSPLTNVTITNFRNYARNLGAEFSQLDYHYFILQLIYLVEYADYNSQSKIGQGYSNSSHTGAIQSGGCDILGMKSESVDGTDNTSVIYRGVEDIFGNVWQFVDGINIKDYQAYICYDKNEYQADKFDGCYQPVGYINASTGEQWISRLGYDIFNPLISLPVETNGTDKTFISDYYFSSSGSTVVKVGGIWRDNTRSGLWYWSNVDNLEIKSNFIGSRLLKTN